MKQSNPFYQIIKKKQPGQRDLLFLYITTYLDSSDYHEDGYELLRDRVDGVLLVIAKVKRSGTALQIIKAITHQIPLLNVDLEEVEEIVVEVKEDQTSLLGMTIVYQDESETVVKPGNYDIEVISNSNADSKNLLDRPHRYALTAENVSAATLLENSAELEASKYITKRIFYGTNRKPTDSLQPEDRYGSDRTDKINSEYGICEVSIPRDHVTGSIERPSWWKSWFSEPSPEEHMTILSLNSQEEGVFLQKLKASFNEIDDKQMLLFVHGYNVDFEESILRTAQLTYDLGFPGPAITYSWPSRGKLFGYMADEASVGASVKYFKQFLTALIQNSGASKLHIIAHSMGNRLVADTMRELTTENIAFQSIIRHIVLAAPDIDASVFKDQVVPAFKGIHRVTLYASSEDKALQMSMSVRAQYPRAGQSGANICLIKGVDTIDASKVATTWLGHGYFADTKALIDDIHMLIKNDLPPARRNLREITSTPVSHWTFPRTE